MSEPSINIPIKTTADPKPVEAMSRSIKVLKAELKTAKADMKAAAPESAPYKAAAAEVDRLNKELGALKKGAGEAAGSKGSGGAGQGMLLLGQALEDAQYGLRGVMNNIPGLVTSFGMGAGAAGVLQIGLVAVSQILDLVKSQSDDMRGKPLLGEMTFDEKIIEQMRQFTDLMERQAQAAKDRNEQLRATQEAVDAAITAEKAMIDFRRQVEDEDFVSTGDPVRDIAEKRDIQLKRLAEDAALRNQERAGKLTTEMAVQGNKEANFKQLNTAEQEQAAKVAQLKQRAALESALAFAMDPKSTLPKGVSANNWLGEALGIDIGSLATQMPGFGSFLASMYGGAKRMDGAQIAAWKSKLDGLPMLPGFEPTGDAAADDAKRRELLAKEQERLESLRQSRMDAGREVDQGYRQLQTVKQTVTGEAALDEVKTQREQEMIQRRAEAAMKRQQEAEAKAAEAQAAAAPSASPDMSGANAFLNRKVAAETDPQMKAKLSGLYTAANDGEGNQQAELNVIREFAQRVGGNAEQNKAALDQALAKMEALQTDGSKMQEMLSRLMVGLIANQQQITTYLQSVMGDVSSLRQQLDSMRK